MLHTAGHMNTSQTDNEDENISSNQHSSAVNFRAHIPSINAELKTVILNQNTTN